MHSLALLCNLHADGPTSLHRLREAGVETLDGVRASNHTALSDWLGVGLPAATRFRKEAEILADRVGAGLLEDEDGVASPQPLSYSRNLKDEVLGERVARFVQAPEGRNGKSPHPGTTPLSTTHGGTNGQRVHGMLEPQPRPQPKPGLAIDGADLDWLTPERRAGLHAAGLTTLGDLVKMDAMDLARALETNFTTARRFQFLASRVPAVAPDSVAAPLPSRGRPLHQRAEGEAPRANLGPGSAGPFA
jgi:hypothetical protein